MKRSKEVLFLHKNVADQFSVRMVEVSSSVFQVQIQDDDGEIEEIKSFKLESAAIEAFHKLVGQTVMEGHTVQAARVDGRGIN